MSNATALCNVDWFVLIWKMQTGLCRVYWSWTLHASRTQCNNDRMQTRLRSLAILEILVSREISLDVCLSLQQVAWYGRPSDKWVSLTMTIEICTLCPQNVTTLSRHNSDIGLHESILTVFGTNVAKKVGSQKVLYFLTSSSACAQYLAIWRKTK